MGVDSPLLSLVGFSVGAVVALALAAASLRQRRRVPRGPTPVR